MPSPSARQKMSPELRRAAILDAALDVFSSRGYAEARLDDIAAAAAIGKGTIYLHFRDKQDLFEQLLKSAALPVLDLASSLATRPDTPTRTILTAVVELFRREVLGTRRREVLRLIIAEGGRFPELAAFYHREVVSRGLSLLTTVLDRGVARGEVDAAYARHPQLVMAPLIMALLWDALFSPVDPLPVEDLLREHVRLVASGGPLSGDGP
ncbi:MAG: TetR/AcrR family transcriptional regulator [Alsobacter sp.]